MSYQGNIATLPLGMMGLVTDLPQNRTDPKALIRAKNIQYLAGMVEKAAGAQRFNDVAITSGLRQADEYWPSSIVQRIIAVALNGKVYKLKDKETTVEVTGSGGAPSFLTASSQVVLCPGGQESTGRNKKLFIFTGKDPVQVISGDADVRTNIATPAADWSTTNQPSAGIPFRSKICAWGNQNNRHTIYMSSLTDHEQFQGGTATQFPVDPGKGDGIACAFVFKRVHG